MPLRQAATRGQGYEGISGAEKKYPRTSRGVLGEQVQGNDPSRPVLEDTPHKSAQTLDLVRSVLLVSNADNKHELFPGSHHSR